MGVALERQLGTSWLRLQLVVVKHLAFLEVLMHWLEVTLSEVSSAQACNPPHLS